MKMFQDIWFVTTADDEQVVIAASENYEKLEYGEWRTFCSMALSNIGLVVHWLIPRCS